MALLLLVLLAAAVALGCGDGGDDADAKCKEASEKASRSSGYDEMGEGMDYFAEHCTWRGGERVAR